MLIIANGAFESGSTWLRNILLELVSVKPIPPAYQHPRYPRWIFRDRLDEFLRDVDCKSDSYATKSHIFSRDLRDQLLANEDVRVVGIERDIRDVLVSHFHHLLRDGRLSDTTDFPEYYRRVGRLKAHQLRRYHLVWNISSPRYLHTTFEALVQNFRQEILRLAAFLEIELDDDDVRRIADATSTETQRSVVGEDEAEEAARFFRKGVVGNWQNHMDEAIAQDALDIYNRGLTGLDLFKYHVAFTARLAANDFLARQVFRFKQRATL